MECHVVLPQTKCVLVLCVFSVGHLKGLKRASELVWMLRWGNKTHTKRRARLMSVYRLCLSELDSGLVAINVSTQCRGALLH